MSDLRELHRQLLQEIARGKGRWRNGPLTAFAALRGSEDSGSLMVVGRAVNGWTSEWHAQEAADADFREGIVAEALAPSEWHDGHPMLWVSECWEATKGYNTRKSAFWRVIRSTVERLGVADVSAATWPSTISWSNLYKISPAAGGNPSPTLADTQLSTCIEILRAEIQSWSPRRVLFLTGLGWAKPFLDGLGFVPETGLSVDHVEANGTIFNKARAVVGPHPQGRAEGRLVAAIVEAFGVAEQIGL